MSWGRMSILFLVIGFTIGFLAKEFTIQLQRLDEPSKIINQPMAYQQVIPKPIIQNENDEFDKNLTSHLILNNWGIRPLDESDKSELNQLHYQPKGSFKK